MKSSFWTLHRILGALLGALGFCALLIGTPSRGSQVRLDAAELARIVEKEVDHVGVDDLAGWIIAGREDFRLVDLRSPQEFAVYHIPRAENVPLTSLMAYGLLRNETIVLYSEGGIHSAQAWFLLKAREYRGVYILRGGLDEWKDRILFPKLPAEQTPENAAAFARAREVSKFFGGTPQTGATEERSSVAAPLPQLPSPASPPAGGPVAGKKKKEGSLVQDEASDVSAAILAGGGSTRMGRDKALITIDGVPMIQRILGTLRCVLDEVSIISDRSEAYAFLNVPVFPDIIHDRGPAAGIHSALFHARTPRVLVVPCDMPYLTEGLIRYLLHFPDAGDACVLEAEGIRNPLCGLYHRRILPILEQEIRAGRQTPQHVLDLLETRTVVISRHLPFYSPRLLANINDAEALREATKETGT